ERAGTDFNSPTATSRLVGTPAYIAPERFDGKPYDGRSDVYSLGIMLYEMLAGRTPFRGGDAGVWSIMMQHLSQPPVSLRELNPEIPEAIEKIVMQTIEKDPDSRPTAKELSNKFLSVTGIDLNIAAGAEHKLIVY